MKKTLSKIIVLLLVLHFILLNSAYFKYHLDFKSLQRGNVSKRDNPIEYIAKILYKRDFLLNHRVKYELMNCIIRGESDRIKILKGQLYQIDSNNYSTMNLLHKLELGNGNSQNY